VSGWRAVIYLVPESSSQSQLICSKRPGLTISRQHSAHHIGFQVGGLGLRKNGIFLLPLIDAPHGVQVMDPTLLR